MLHQSIVSCSVGQDARNKESIVHASQWKSSISCESLSSSIVYLICYWKVACFQITLKSEKLENVGAWVENIVGKGDIVHFGAISPFL